MKAWVAIVFLAIATAHAKPPKLTKATGEIIRTKGKIQTGTSSRIELELPYLAIVRVGSNAEFTFSPDAKSLSLAGGTMMLSMPVKTEGVSVESGSTVTTPTKGALEMSNVGGRVKVIILDGKIAVSLAANPSDRRNLRSGQMVDVPAGATSMPPIAAVKLSTLLKTSILLNMGPFPGLRAIKQNATSQQPPRPFVTGGFNPDWGAGQASLLSSIGPAGTIAGLSQMKDARAAQVISVLGPNSNIIPTGAQLATLEEAGKPLPKSNQRALEANQGKPASRPGQTARPKPPGVVTPPIVQPTPRPFPTRPTRPGQGLPRPPIFRPPIAVP